jgi:hypothetical protein
MVRRTNAIIRELILSKQVTYMCVCVHYRKNNGVSSKLAPVIIVTLWIQVVMTNCCWKQWNTARGVLRVQFLLLLLVDEYAFFGVIPRRL